MNDLLVEEKFLVKASGGVAVSKMP